MFGFFIRSTHPDFSNKLKLEWWAMPTLLKLLKLPIDNNQQSTNLRII
jgi:hypothetical protein